MYFFMWLAEDWLANMEKVAAAFQAAMK